MSQAQQQEINQQGQQVDELRTQLQQVVAATQRASAAAQNLQNGADQAQKAAAQAQRSAAEAQAVANQASSNAAQATTALGIVQTQTDNEATQLTALEAIAGRFRLSGDVRVRGESYNQSTLPDRNRARIRARVGLDGELNEDFVGGIAVATGSLGDPTSTNETLTNVFDRKTIALDRAFVTFNPVAPQVDIAYRRKVRLHVATHFGDIRSGFESGGLQRKILIRFWRRA